VFICGYWNWPCVRKYEEERQTAATLEEITMKLRHLTKVLREKHEEEEEEEED
jgi:hypothetical protein